MAVGAGPLPGRTVRLEGGTEHLGKLPAQGSENGRTAGEINGRSDPRMGWTNVWEVCLISKKHVRQRLHLSIGDKKLVQKEMDVRQWPYERAADGRKLPLGNGCRQRWPRADVRGLWGAEGRHLSEAVGNEHDDRLVERNHCAFRGIATQNCGRRLVEVFGWAIKEPLASKDVDPTRATPRPHHLHRNSDSPVTTGGEVGFMRRG